MAFPESGLHSGTPIKKIPAACFFIFVFLLTTEVFLRIQEPFLGLAARYDVSRSALDAIFVYQPHSLWDHSLNPAVHRMIIRGGEECLFETNSQGFKRAADVRMPKPEGVFRIFVLGDSFTEGGACGPAVSDWIERILRERQDGKEIEVINAGVASQSVIPYIIRLRHQIFPLAPDLIIVNIDNSDVRDDSYLLPVLNRDADGMPESISRKYLKYTALRAWMAGPSSQTLLKSGRYFYLLRMCWSLYFRVKQIELENEQSRVVVHNNSDERELLRDYSWIKNKNLAPLEQSLLSAWKVWPEMLVRLCRENKVPVILSTYPHPEQLMPESGHHLQNALAEIARNYSVLYFDAEKSLSKENQELMYLPDDVHFSAYGTRKWGEALGEFVDLQTRKQG